MQSSCHKHLRAHILEEAEEDTRGLFVMTRDSRGSKSPLSTTLSINLQAIPCMLKESVAFLLSGRLWLKPESCRLVGLPVTSIKHNC